MFTRGVMQKFNRPCDELQYDITPPKYVLVSMSDYLIVICRLRSVVLLVGQATMIECCSWTNSSVLTGQWSCMITFEDQGFKGLMQMLTGTMHILFLLKWIYGYTLAKISVYTLNSPLLSRRCTKQFNNLIKLKRNFTMVWLKQMRIVHQAEIDG